MKRKKYIITEQLKWEEAPKSLFGKSVGALSKHEDDSFILEKSISYTYSEKNYKKYTNLIKKYIKTAMKSDVKINKYVNNQHISERFRDVLIYLELENMYKDIFHDTENYDYPHYILKYLETDEYFNSIKLKMNQEDEIHRVYQKLREKEDEIRNTKKLIAIVYRDNVMPHLSYRDLKAHRIRIK